MLNPRRQSSRLFVKRKMKNMQRHRKKESCLEDSIKTILAKVMGTWGKLQYVASLRQPEGTYFHWGLTRLYGERAVRKALVEVHVGLVRQVLRSPLSELLEDLKREAEDCGSSSGQCLSNLSRCAAELVPAESREGSRRKFNSVLTALSAIVQAEPPTASGASRASRSNRSVMPARFVPGGRGGKLQSSPRSVRPSTSL